MPKSTDQSYLILKSQSDGVEDLIGRLLFQLVGLQDNGNARIASFSDEEKARHAEQIRYEHSNGLQGQIIEKVLKDIRQIVSDKEVDLSDVISGLGQVVDSLESGNSASQEAFKQLIGQFPEMGSKLAEIAKLVAENKPQEVIFDELIQSNEAGFSVLGKLIVKLTEEVKKNTFPTEIAISKPIEIEKPKWWKEFTFSWEPLEKIFEKFSKRTFKIKADEPIEVEVKGLPKEVAHELSKELTRLLPLFAPKAGYNNPFAFDKDGNLKVASSGSNGGFEIVGLKNVAGDQLNPATAEGQDAILNELTQKTEPRDVQLGELTTVLRNLFNVIANPSYIDKTLNRMRQTAILESGTVTTVTTLTGLTNVDGYQGKLLIINQNISAWANCVRSRIS